MSNLVSIHYYSLHDVAAEIKFRMVIVRRLKIYFYSLFMNYLMYNAVQFVNIN